MAVFSSWAFPFARCAPPITQKEHWAIRTWPRRTKLGLCNESFVIRCKGTLNSISVNTQPKKSHLDGLDLYPGFPWFHGLGLKNSNSRLVLQKLALFMIVFHYYASPTGSAGIFSPHMPTTYVNPTSPVGCYAVYECMTLF